MVKKLLSTQAMPLGLIDRKGANLITYLLRASCVPLVILFMAQTAQAQSSSAAAQASGCPPELSSQILAKRPAANDSAKTLQTKLTELGNLVSDMYMKGSPPKCAALAQTTIGQHYQRAGNSEEAKRRFAWADEIATLPVTRAATPSAVAKSAAQAPSPSSAGKSTTPKPNLRPASTIMYVFSLGPNNDYFQAHVGTGADAAEAGLNLYLQYSDLFDRSGRLTTSYHLGGPTGVERVQCNTAGWWATIYGNYGGDREKELFTVACGEGHSRDEVISSAVGEFRRRGGKINGFTTVVWSYNDGSSRQSKKGGSMFNGGDLLCHYGPRPGSNDFYEDNMGGKCGPPPRID
jgi:hypothetical protein